MKLWERITNRKQSTPPIPVVGDDVGAITADFPCTECGYNLRQLRYADGCPECGQPVSYSWNRDLLCFADRAWLKRVHRGLALIRATFLFPIAAMFGLVVLAWVIDVVGIQALVVLGEWILIVSSIALPIAIVVSYPLGVWWVTTPEDGEQYEVRLRRRRARWMGAAASFNCLLGGVGIMMAIDGDCTTGPGRVGAVLGFVCLIFATFQLFALTALLTGLCRRGYAMNYWQTRRVRRRYMVKLDASSGRLAVVLFLGLMGALTGTVVYFGMSINEPMMMVYVVVVGAGMGSVPVWSAIVAADTASVVKAQSAVATLLGLSRDEFRDAAPPAPEVETRDAWSDETTVDSAVQDEG